MTAEEQHLAALLRETTAADANRIGAAEAQLASASDQPGFAAALLGCVSRAAPGADGQADPNALLVAVLAAAALHNYARARWPKLIPGEREPITPPFFSPCSWRLPPGRSCGSSRRPSASWSPRT